jgi:hypothetical protein
MLLNLFFLWNLSLEINGEIILIVKMFVHEYYAMNIFPFEDQSRIGKIGNKGM